MIKPTIKYGVLCGVFLIALFVVLGSAMMDMKHSFFDSIIIAVFIFFAAKEFKTYHNNGVLHFWQGMTIGFIVYSIATVLFCVTIAVLYAVNHSWLDNYILDATNQLTQHREKFPEKISESELTKKIGEIKQTTNSLLVADSFLRKLISGLFVSPIISIILRRKPSA